ncbi:ribonuclease [Sphingomonas naphthae]|uniref:Ribonuclease n=1 Tax=Sphingomonas naphthae TaxID=1813468 RepID=A0ABY7TIF5_9SPHN|nr:ribonuclease [Sphingomonas naphthae]WCT73006.1 ribonuclease [Sphingomonas naphthae]
MAEWIYEAGIGEARAALVDGGDILEVLIERAGAGVRAGAVLPVRLRRRADATGRGLVELPDGGEALLDTVPPATPEGATIHAEVAREAIPEGRAMKPARLRATEASLREAPALAERIAAGGHRVVTLAGHQPDALEAAGWSEALGEAASGIVARDAARLQISLTPAMTLIDVDGTRAPAELAVIGARMSGAAIRRFDIGGSIGIDLPTLAGKAERQAAAAALDAALPPPFERTAFNGFGFLQIVRRRLRPSIPELMQHDPALAAALALLRRAEREPGAGARTLVAAPAVVAKLAPAWIEELRRRVGAGIALRAEAALAISAGHVHVEHQA